MSRGFVKEDDLEHAGTDLPERPISALPNYVTNNGLVQLEQNAKALSAERLILLPLKDDQAAMQKLAVIERDLRYVSARLNTAILSAPPLNNEMVLFGATVAVEDEAGKPHIFTIVGDDEADIKLNKVSWGSPIAKALIKQKVGDIVVWSRPAGNMTLEIIKISY
ncbi:MAG: GreA/GreB family elongation factor [Betaproteobacteria bacterium]